MSDEVMEAIQDFISLDPQEKKEKAKELSEKKIDISRYRNERNLMLYPFCSTARGKRIKPIKYQSANKKRFLEVTANAEYGMVKIWDFDILRFALSKAGEIALKTGYFYESVQFSGYECLNAISRKSEGANYIWLRKALDRIASTTYKGNIFDDRDVDVFTLCSVRYTDISGKLEKITITFNKRLINSVRDNRGLLSTDQAVLRENSGIKKRLLELVKTSLNDKTEWKVSVLQLQKLCAHDGELRKFKEVLKGYELPWKIAFYKGYDGAEIIRFLKITD